MCESLQHQLLIEKSKQEEESLEGENPHKYVMSLRGELGSRTTIESFYQFVRNRLDKDKLTWLKNNKYGKGKGKEQEYIAHNKFGEVHGYTLDQEVLDSVAGHRKQGLCWLWQAGNYLITADGDVYFFL